MAHQTQLNVLSLEGLLYKALSEMRKLGVDLNKMENELVQDQAKVFGGLGEKKNHGVIAELISIGMNAANEAAKALRIQSFGALASGVVGILGSVGMSRLAGKNFAPDEFTSELEDVQKFKAAIPKNANPEFNMSKVENSEQAQGQAIKERINELMRPPGEEDKMNRFTSKDRLNKLALQRLEGDRDLDRAETIRGNAEAYEKSLQRQIAEFNSRQANTKSQYYGQGITAITSSAENSSRVVQSCEQQKSEQNQTRDKAMEQVSSQLSSQIQAAEQQATQYNEEAASAASAYAQLKQPA
jgi:hypothetical protein